MGAVRTPRACTLPVGETGVARARAAGRGGGSPDLHKRIAVVRAFGAVRAEGRGDRPGRSRIVRDFTLARAGQAIRSLTKKAVWAAVTLAQSSPSGRSALPPQEKATVMLDSSAAPLRNFRFSPKDDSRKSKDTFFSQLRKYHLVKHNECVWPACLVGRGNQIGFSGPPALKHCVDSRQ